MSDFYFNSGRLVAANLIWGVAAVGVGLMWLVSPLLALLLAPLLAFPTVGIFRLAARIVRQDGQTSVRDALAAFRDFAGPTILLGVATVVAFLVLATNAIVGLTQSEPLGWFVGTLAAWSLVILWCATIVAWPLLVDPERAGDPLGMRLRLVGLLLLAHPIRFALLGAVVAIASVLSAILLAALLTISVSFIALIACRYVYALADRFEAAHGEP